MIHKKQTLIYCFATAILLAACSTTTNYGVTKDVRVFESHKWAKIERNIEIKNAPKMTSLEEVNNYVNKVKYKAEPVDDWKTPERFFKEGGDCEDYAIAKYALIKQNNLTKTGSMSVLLVFDNHIQQPHAILLVDDEYILDNQVKQILPARKARDRYTFLGKVKH